jgi:hypothetical protein
MYAIASPYFGDIIPVLEGLELLTAKVSFTDLLNILMET